MSAYAKKRKVRAGAVILIAVLVIILAVIFIFAFGGSGGTVGKIRDDILGDGGSSNGSALGMIDESELPDATQAVQTTDETGDTQIVFSDGGITVMGSGAIADGNYVKIVRGGIYSLSGSSQNARIAVRAQGEDVVLILNGVNISCADSAPLYVNKAASVTLLLNGNTENVFSDGTSYDYTLEYGDAVGEEPNACIHSKADLKIRGTGSLKVIGNYNSGIIGKDTLEIINTTVEVTAKNNGINGKDSLTIQNSTVKVDAGGDALRSTQDNDPSLGWGKFVNSNIYLTARAGDAVQVETGLDISGCSMSVKAGDNGHETAASEESLKGLKCNQGGITVDSGTVIIDTSDDALHSAGDVNINGGTISIATGDDAVHSDANIYIKGGKTEIPVSHEGLEGVLIEISGGEVYINADDDGINAAGGNDNSSADFRGGMGMQESDGSYLGITGGFVYINSVGDGIDSNGDIYMSGGTLIISGPERDADGAIDYAGDFHTDGGLLFAAGAAGMAQAPDNMTVNTLSVTFDNVLDAGTVISISGGGKEFVFKIDKRVGNIVFSSPELETGVEYAVSYGGKYSGEFEYCVGSGGKYSGGTEVATVAVTEGLNSYGRVGIGGSMGGRGFGEGGKFGGMGGEGHQNPFGGQPGNMPVPPDGGNPPQMPVQS